MKLNQMKFFSSENMIQTDIFSIGGIQIFALERSRGNGLVKNNWWNLLPHGEFRNGQTARLWVFLGWTRRTFRHVFEWTGPVPVLINGLFWPVRNKPSVFLNLFRTRSYVTRPNVMLSYCLFNTSFESALLTDFFPKFWGLGDFSKVPIVRWICVDSRWITRFSGAN